MSGEKGFKGRGRGKEPKIAPAKSDDDNEGLLTAYELHAKISVLSENLGDLISRYSGSHSGSFFSEDMRLKEEIAKIKEEITALNKVVATQLADLQRREKLLEDKLRVVNENLARVSGALSTAVKRNKELMAAREKETEALRKEFDKSLKNLRDENEALRGENEDLKSKNKALQEESSKDGSSEEQIKRLEGTIERLKAEIKRLKTEEKANAKARAEAKAKTDKKHERVLKEKDALAEQVNKLRGDIAKLSKRIDESSKQLSSARDSENEEAQKSHKRTMLLLSAIKVSTDIIDSVSTNHPDTIDSHQREAYKTFICQFRDLIKSIEAETGLNISDATLFELNNMVNGVLSPDKGAPSSVLSGANGKAPKLPPPPPPPNR